MVFKPGVNSRPNLTTHVHVMFTTHVHVMFTTHVHVMFTTHVHVGLPLEFTMY